MWCVPCCFKPSTSEDRFEAETSHVIQVSQHEADIQRAKQLSLANYEAQQLDLATHEAEQLDLAIQEISRQEEEEERRRTRELENDAQIANALQDEERERLINKKTALEDEEDEQLAKILEAEQLDLAIQESSRLLQEEEEERRRTRELENDAQIANALLYEERERQMNNRSAAEDEKNVQLAKALREILKENGNGKRLEDEQVKKDRELAERLNMLESPPQSKQNFRISHRAPSNVDEQFANILEESSKDKGKGKQLEDEQVKKDRELTERLTMLESPPRLEENNNISTGAPFDEDEQRIILESLKGKGQITQSKEEVDEDGKLLEVNPPRSMCGGCSSAVDHGRSVNVSGVLWHPNCLICDACNKLIAIHEVESHVSNSRGKYHKSCYERYCCVCKEKKMRNFNEHEFWKERYCPAHEADGTPKCFSCERLESRGTNHVMLGDGRWLCLECMNSALMDSDECQPLHFDMREFFEGLHMKIDKEFPFLLVEKQALNKAEKEEKIEDYQYEVVTRGICLSEEQIVTSVSKMPKEVLNNRLVGMARESQRVVRKCEVTAILILYGLPRLLTGYILAHEMMHAYLRLSGHRKLNKVLEEGICQVLGHMWLESQTYASVDASADAASSSASSSSLAPQANASKKGEWSDFEKKLVGFCKNQIETDESPVYGVGFKKVNEMMKNSNIQDTLKEILRRS